MSGGLRLSYIYTGCSGCIKTAAIASAAYILGLCKPKLLPSGGRAVSVGGAGQEMQPTYDSTGVCSRATSTILHCVMRAALHHLFTRESFPVELCLVSPAYGGPRTARNPDKDIAPTASILKLFLAHFRIWWLQGVSLVLSSCATLKHSPERGTLACMSAAMRRNLAAFKRQELASSLEAFKAFNFHPGNDLLQVPPAH